MKSYSISVVGAGMVGVATALWLQKSGHAVTLIDPNPPGSGASYGNACVIANYGIIPVATPGIIQDVPSLLFRRDSPLSISWPYLPKLLPWLWSFLRASSRSRVADIAADLATLHHQVNDGIQPLFEAAGVDRLIHRQGALYLYASEAAYQSAAQMNQLRRDNGVLLIDKNKDEIADMEPHLKRVYQRGIHFPDAYQLLDPLQAVSQMAAVFEAQGGVIKTVAIDHIATAGDQVQLKSTGQQFDADKVVIAAGAWSKQFCDQLGDQIPLETERGYHVMYPGSTSLLHRPVGWDEGGFYCVPMAQGLRVAGTVELGGLEAPESPRRTQMIDRNVRKLLPIAEAAGETWLGFRPSLPDSMPVIGASPHHSNVLYAFGHGHLGLTLGGITGKLITQLVDGVPTDVDLNPFRASRF